MPSPRKLYTGIDRPVNVFQVKTADNASTEREQLNRILKELNRKVELANAGGGGGTGADGADGAAGSRGATGATGATGAAGPGVATGGAMGEALVKLSGTDYDTGWSAVGAGTVTSVTATAPIVITGVPTVAPNVTITAATGADPGSMSAADKTKLDAISGTNTGDQTITLTGDVTGSGTGSFAATLATAQPLVHTWAQAQTFTVAPVFTDQPGSRTALGLGTAATKGTLDTIDVAVASVDFNAQQALSFRIENRTDDTGMTNAGNIWLRTDL